MEDSNLINDVALEQDLSDYVPRNLKRKKILDFMKRHYELYYSSIATLDRRLQFFFMSMSNPMIIGRKYLQFLHEVRALLRFIQNDCGSGTGEIVTIYTYLSCKVSNLDDPMHSVI